MHTPTKTELANLAHRWSDHPDFEWVMGMRTNRGEIVVGDKRGQGITAVSAVDGRLRYPTDTEMSDRWPDLADAATVGALWALLCEAEPSLSVSCTGLAWVASVIRDGGRCEVAVAYSRVGVLVAAWEAL